MSHATTTPDALPLPLEKDVLTDVLRRGAQQLLAQAIQAEVDDYQDIHPKRAAVAFDVTAETMLRYYTATEKKKTADDVLGGLADDLLPKKNLGE